VLPGGILRPLIIGRATTAEYYYVVIALQAKTLITVPGYRRRVDIRLREPCQSGRILFTLCEFRLPRSHQVL
jgi:hypothetical protein